jgi:hypothetical protein
MCCPPQFHAGSVTLPKLCPLPCNCYLCQCPSHQQVNNAGILVRQTWDKETYDNTLAVNTAGPVLLSHALLPLLAPGALIVNVSSSELGFAVTALAIRVHCCSHCYIVQVLPTAANSLSICMRSSSQFFHACRRNHSLVAVGRVYTCILALPCWLAG